MTPPHSLLLSRVPLMERFSLGSVAPTSPDGLRIELIYEETISTFENPPETAARIFEPQFYKERACDSAQSPASRTEAINTGLAARGMGDGGANRPRLRAPVRLKQGRDFARLRQQGQRLAWGCIALNWQTLSPDSPSRLGVISSRRIGNAVARNRARRLLREVFRLHQHGLARSVDMVLVARASIAGKPFAAVEKDFLTTLRKARLLKVPIA